jgi:hypothetical protein
MVPGGGLQDGDGGIIRYSSIVVFWVQDSTAAEVWHIFIGADSFKTYVSA